VRLATGALYGGITLLRTHSLRRNGATPAHRDDFGRLGCLPAVVRVLSVDHLGGQRWGVVASVTAPGRTRGLLGGSGSTMVDAASHASCGRYAMTWRATPRWGPELHRTGSTAHVGWHDCASETSVLRAFQCPTRHRSSSRSSVDGLGHPSGAGLVQASPARRRKCSSALA